MARIAGVNIPTQKRVEIALRHKAVPFELSLLDMSAKPAFFQEMAPEGTVPVLRHMAVVVADSGVILEYLEDAFPGPPLLPEAASARAETRAMLRYMNEKLHPAVMRVVSAPQAQLDGARVGLVGMLTGLEERLRRFAGARGRDGALTMADAAFATFPERLAALPPLRGVEVALPPHTADWAAALLQRPEVAATVLPVSDHMANLARYLPEEQIS
jgi:glutathione S-transferase